MLAWALTFGSAAWLLDATVAGIAPVGPLARWYGWGRPLQAFLITPVVAVAFETAERWPVRSWRDTRRLLGQFGIALLLGPVWGTLAYWLNPALSVWNGSAGRWGIIAIEAKGVLFSYGTCAALAHTALRARRQRARALAAYAVRADLAASRVQAVTLGMHTERVTAALDAVLERLPDHSAGAMEVLVGVADAISGALAMSRANVVPLRDVLALADAHAALVHSARPHDVFRWTASDAALAARVAPMAVWPELARAVHHVATGTARSVDATPGAPAIPTYAEVRAHVERTTGVSAVLVVYVERSTAANERARRTLRVPLSSEAA